MTRPLIFVFPGQSSRDPEMFERAARLAPDATRRALADFRSLAGHAFDGTYASNLDVQLAVHLATRLWREHVSALGLAPVASAGLSLGEYSHLVEIGALSQDAADVLVAARGRHYDQGPSGRMVAVTGPAPEEVAASLAVTRQALSIDEDQLAISNLNSPRQVVIAGRRDAVDAAVARLEDVLFAMTTVIEDRVPMHVGRFAPVSRAFARELRQAPWQAPRATWWSNVSGDAVVDPTATMFASTMADHVDHCARWSSLFGTLTARHPNAVVLEVGPGRVLTGLASRFPGVRALAVDATGDRGDLWARLSEVTDGD